MDMAFEASVQLEEWKMALRHTCVNAEGYEAPTEVVPVPTPTASGKIPDGGGVIFRDPFKIAVPKSAGGATWVAYTCELHQDGTFQYMLDDASLKDDLPPDWGGGRVDIKRAIGVWLLGAGGFRHLDIITPGRKFALSADKEMTLDRWKKQCLDLMPHKPVQEMMRGWLEKKGDVGTGGASNWKMRFWVLLSTRELIYYESDTSTKRKGTIDLKTAQSINLLPDEFFNYEDAFEIVTGKRHWVLCPSSKKDRKEWIEALKPMIAGEGADDAKGDDKRQSTAASFGRTSTMAKERDSSVSTARFNPTSPQNPADAQLRHARASR